MRKIASLAFLTFSLGLLTSRAEVRINVTLGTGWCAPSSYVESRCESFPRPCYEERTPVVIYPTRSCDDPCAVRSVWPRPVVVIPRPTYPTCGYRETTRCEERRPWNPYCAESEAERREAYRHWLHHRWHERQCEEQEERSYRPRYHSNWYER